MGIRRKDSVESYLRMWLVVWSFEISHCPRTGKNGMGMQGFLAIAALQKDGAQVNFSIVTALLSRSYDNFTF